ncbi:hypothetical protein Trydic_g3704 [Trypoxylus dichotomus]
MRSYWSGQVLLVFYISAMVKRRNALVEANQNQSFPTMTTTTSIYCEEDTTYIGTHKLTWVRTPIGSPAYSNEFCSDENGIVPHRDCSGDYNSSPGKWMDVVGNCSGTFPTSNVTNFLHRIMVKYAVNGTWNFEDLMRISYNIQEFTCIDLFLLAKALYYMTIEEYMYNLFDHFERTLDNTLEVFTLLNDKCQTFNASSYILGAVNVFFNRVTEEPNDLKKIVKPNFIFQISNPFVENITGLGLYRNKDDSFENYTLREIFLEEYYDDTAMDNLELAGYVPDDLIGRLAKTLGEEEKSKFRIIIVAFRNNDLFNLGGSRKVISKVIGISISGFCSRTKTSLFDIYSKPLIPGDSHMVKGEWFTVNNDDIYSEKILTECNYPPVTYMFLYDDGNEKNQTCRKEKYPFAELSVQESQSSAVSFHNQHPVFDILSSLSISINYAQPQTVIEAIYKRHHFFLKAIMLIGCTLSLFGLLATIVTLISIKNWHKKRMYTIQLEIAMGFETFLFLIDSDISYITYIILYYFILSQFSWMMLIGYTQYLKFVKVFDDSSSNFLKSLLIGWILPGIVIVIPLIIYPECLFCEFCPAKRSILIYFVIIPTSLIILINITIYLLVMISISKSKGQQYGANISKKRTRVGILLPFMLGITWIFVFALVSPWRWFSLAGSYLFHLIAPMQAFVLFIFVVVLDKSTRSTWKGHWGSVRSKLSVVKKEENTSKKVFSIT